MSVGYSVTIGSARRGGFGSAAGERACPEVVHEQVAADGQGVAGLSENVGVEEFQVAPWIERAGGGHPGELLRGARRANRRRRCARSGPQWSAGSHKRLREL